jgi:hypothetical protein
MRYDEQVDALYLSLDESDVVESEEVKPGIVLARRWRRFGRRRCA